HAQAWAERQFSRASQLIRSSSVASTPSLREIRNQVQASDGNFFEHFTTIAHTTMPSLSAKENETFDINSLLKNCSINGDQKSLEDLYVEAVYTIVHRVGRFSGIADDKLTQYVQQSFRFDDERHMHLLSRANEEKPPVVLLNVLLLEARDLIAKDVNGFSDPFSMMGVIPGKTSKFRALDGSSVTDKSETEKELASNVDDSDIPPLSPRTAEKQKQLGGVLHRFGGSFQRRIGSSKRQKKESDNKQIPAKLIKASSVQRKTLNPKWNEKFQFVVDDVNTDRFHMDIWDHDDEEQSVMDAVTSLNHISGLKGLGRYFKEVTQSARADSQSCMDDFLGCITLRIKDIPSVGIEDWFTLEKRSERSEVSGQVKLKLWLSTKEERNELDEDDLIDVRQHIGLIRQFALHEISQSGAPVSAYQGELSSAAATILHQHAIQGDLTELHQALCSWLAYSSLLNIGISYSFLFDVLSDLISKWVPLILDKDDENLLGNSFAMFDQHCRLAIMDHRIRFPTNRRDSCDSIANLLRCMKLMRESCLYEKCVPLQRSFDATLSAQVEMSAEAYFKKAMEDAANDDPCVELSLLLDSVNIACAQFSSYDPIFKAFTGIDYASISYYQFNRMLEEYLCSELMSESAMDLKTSLIEASKRDGDNGRSLITLIRIHFALLEFRNYRTSKSKDDEDNDEWGFIFDRAIGKWTDLMRVRAFARVDLSCQLDANIQASNDIKYSSSYVDICHMIEQIITTWERMRVSDVRLRVDLTEKVVQSICKIAEYYVDKILAQLASDGFCGDLQVFIPGALVSMFCAAINNAEQVRRRLLFHDKLHLDEIATIYRRVTQCEPKWRNKIEKEIDDCDRYINEQIDATTDRLIRRLRSQLKKHVFHLAWSPYACAVESAIKPLTDMLDAELSSVHRTLLHKNFVRVMLSQLNTLVPLLQDCVDENPGLEPIFYQRLYDGCSVLTDFFHADGKGISMETFTNLPVYQKLMSTLSLNQTSTVQLIEQYYKDLLKEQNDVSECKYGILNVRAYYNTNSQTLVIDVIGAKQLIPLDSNGLSDPFVVTELVPRMRYPSQPLARTRVVSKSLNPIFDETFEFHIPSKIPSFAAVHFIVMDHDFLRSNDFAGEAFLDLAEVPGIGTAAGSALRQFNLILIHPSKKEKASTAVLSSRKDDKDAQDFVRSLNTVY
uniref:BAI1-associated protein 3 n=1 Tax=Parascaris univalens TaxID=6257 RepID=A0A915C336_PARUN